ncbi:hypothetical protein ACVR05_03560 [Streptococcus caprae]|uniref:Transposase n=1 Tax=Streptococcus caprae TaxID=1640501 RepID=A0ABV8CSI0_9STRE
MGHLKPFRGQTRKLKQLLANLPREIAPYLDLHASQRLLADATKLHKPIRRQLLADLLAWFEDLVASHPKGLPFCQSVLFIREDNP